MFRPSGGNIRRFAWLNFTNDHVIFALYDHNQILPSLRKATISCVQPVQMSLIVYAVVVGSPFRLSFPSTRYKEKPNKLRVDVAYLLNWPPLQVWISKERNPPLHLRKMTMKANVFGCGFGRNYDTHPRLRLSCLGYGLVQLRLDARQLSIKLDLEHGVR